MDTSCSKIVSLNGPSVTYYQYTICWVWELSFQETRLKDGRNNCCNEYQVIRLVQNRVRVATRKSFTFIVILDIIVSKRVTEDSKEEGTRLLAVNLLSGNIFPAEFLIILLGDWRHCSNATIEYLL